VFVSFYITNTTGWPCTGLNGNANNPGPVNVTSQASLTLSAPTSGTYAGIAVFENRAITGSQASGASINGGTIDGAFYFPNSSLSFASSGDATGYQMLIADTVNFNGGFSLSMNKFPPEFAANHPAFRQWIVMGE